MRCGTVLFDEMRPEGGWASIDGEEAFRIKGICDLRSDVLWWTSLDVQNFYRAGMSRMAHMRNSDYLRTSMSMLMDELGITSRFIPVNDAVVVLSEIFSRVMNLSEMHYGLLESRCQKLSDDLRVLLLPQDNPLSNEMDLACSQSYQAFVKCTKNPSRVRSRGLLFKRNRYHHAMDVLSTPIPGLQFSYIERKSLPPKNERMKWVLDLKQPVLVEGAIASVAQEYANVISFGSGANHRRRWISHPELLALSKFASIDIDSVFLFNEYKPLVTKIPAPEVEPGFGQLSISIGLLAENFWVGLATPQAFKFDMSNKLHAPRVSWLRASDRCFTMLRAMEVHKQGIQINSYGVGSVTIDVPFGNLTDVIEIAGGAGLYPPLSVPEDSVVREELA
ncbi:hypothetical protein ACKF11_13485 [Methylobacillus sp. Pita2]|uniref:hypothetical protein n=1 Tax=Methylobacillus sp. Pita2 TaxID=3383245 RepID=UPI0038B55565